MAFQAYHVGKEVKPQASLLSDVGLPGVANVFNIDDYISF